jgi:membrane dipeptidase
MLIVDAHQDLAWNIISFGRDYSLAAAETRRREWGTDIPSKNGDTLLGWPDYQKGDIALVFATLFVSPTRRKLGDWDSQCYGDISEAQILYTRQLDAYYRLVDKHADKFNLIHTQGDLDALLTQWQDEDVHSPPVGLVVLMEGAEAVRTPSELEDWWARGVRIIGPAWAGTRFCGGTMEPGPLTKEGYALLEGMASFGFVLDTSHMDEKAVLQALDVYPGTIIASHSNATSLLKNPPSNRLLPDRVIEGLIERDSIIGIVPFNHFLVSGWTVDEGRERVGLNHVVAQIDHICQIAGDACHVGIGSDFDGGFGVQKVPGEIDTVADLGKIAPLLAEKGYTEEDVAAVMGRNWLNCLQGNLPESV